MKHSIHKLLSILFAVSLMLTACAPAPQEVEQQLSDQLATMVASTLTARPTLTPVPTNTPFPTATQTEPPTPTFVIPTVTALEMIIPTARPEYACDVTKRKPADDTEFRHGDPFDIEWTILNSGTQTWEKETVLLYQTGPEMSDVKKVALPQLKPGQSYDVVLDAIAPKERKLHVMVWAVVGPGHIKGSMYWMCYPYIRIQVKK